MLANENMISLFVKGLRKRVKKIELFVKYTVCGHEDIILVICNTSYDVIHIKNRLHQHYNVVP